jgi:hypothetical protein
MEATSVQISKATREIAEKGLTPKKKGELRKQLILSFVKSKPLGTYIKLSDFRAIGDFPHEGAAHTFVMGMVGKGMLEKEALGPRRFTYRVPGAKDSDVKILRAATPRLTMDELEEQAMKFAWDNPEKNNDLRGFIGALKEFIKSKTNTNWAEVEKLNK